MILGIDLGTKKSAKGIWEKNEPRQKLAQSTQWFDSTATASGKSETH